jgi:beta-ribofuranosylaminobenzene 5'-phosphate synthase
VSTNRIRTGSRLHLGLLSLPGATGPGPLAARHFGGVGLMIEEPAVEVTAAPAREWAADGPARERALDTARRAAAALPEERRRPLRIRVEQCPQEHVGLGTGTQLTLAVAMAARSALGDAPDPIALAAEVGRGMRSGIGVHGFVKGGFLVDGGKGPNTPVAPLICRHDFPSDWRILLAMPRHEQGLAGAGERAAFSQLGKQAANPAETEMLCRLVLLGLLPALTERDLPAFGEAVFEFNRRAGLLFKASQGGEYRSPEAAALVAALRDFGVRGVGQSSWGPTIFAIDEADRLTAATEYLRRRMSELELSVTTARNRGWHAAASERSA